MPESTPEHNTAEGTDLPVPSGRTRLRIAVFVASLLLFAFAFEGTRGLWEPDEGRYVGVAMEMLRSGDFVVPRIHDEYPHLSKPPLTYWAIAASVATFGRNEFAARLPHGLAFFLTMLLVWGMAHRIGTRNARFAAVVYAAMLLPYVASNIASTDTLLALWETAAGTAFVMAWWGPASSSRRWINLMWAAFGLGFLTKGPVALMPLFGIIAVRIAGRHRDDRPRLVTIVGLAAFLVLGFGWYAFMVIQDPNLVRYFIGYELIDRVATDKLHRNPGLTGLIFAYVPTIIFGTLPWTGALFRRWRKIAGVVRPRWWRQIADADPAGLFFAAWIVGALIVFSLSQSRLHLYLLPLAAPAAVLIARTLAPDWRWSKVKVVTFSLWLAFLLSLRVVSASVNPKDDALHWSREIARVVDLHNYDEIVFVGVRPILGLGLYDNVEVEPVLPKFDMKYGKKYRYAAHTLDFEFHERERCVYLVAPVRKPDFIVDAHHAGLEVRVLGTIDLGDLCVVD